MRVATFFMTALTILFLSVSPAAAGKNIAELFPAETLAYVEICRPGETAKQLSILFKGTALENALPTLDKLRTERNPNMWFELSEVGFVSSLLGPEMLQEAGRFDGIAAALTGFSKKGAPEYAAVVLTGESQLPGFFLRSYISMSHDLRKVDEREGVGLYQKQPNPYANMNMPPDFNNPIDGAVASPPKTESAALVIAYAPGIVVVGSTTNAVGGIIRRWKEKDKSPSFAQGKAFSQTAEMRRTAGIFVTADGKKLLERFAAIRHDRQNPEPTASVLLKRLLPAAGADLFTGRLEFGDNGLSLRLSLRLDGKSPSSSSPLAAVLGGPALSGAEIRGLDKDSPLCVAVNLPSGAERVSSLLGFLDQLVKSTGALGPSASELVQELREKKLLAPGVLEKIEGLSLVIPPVPSSPAGPPPWPSLLVRTESAEAAEALEAVVPAVVEILLGQKAAPLTETIDGVKSRTLVVKALPAIPALHYARRDRMFALGTDRRFLAACLNADPAHGLATASDIPTVLNGDKPAMLGVVNWSTLLAPRKADAASKKKNAGPPVPPEQRVENPGNGQPSGMPIEALQALHALPPLLVAASCRDNELRLSIYQHDPKKLRATGLERWLIWYAKSRPGAPSGTMIWDMDGSAMQQNMFPPIFPPAGP